MGFLEVTLGMTAALLALTSTGGREPTQHDGGEVDRATASFMLARDGPNHAARFSFSVDKPGTMVGVLACGPGPPLVSLLLEAPGHQPRVFTISDGPIVVVDHVTVEDSQLQGQWTLEFIGTRRAECTLSLDHGGIVSQFGAAPATQLTAQRDTTGGASRRW